MMLGEILKEVDPSSYPSPTKASYDFLANLSLPVHIAINCDWLLEESFFRNRENQRPTSPIGAIIK